MSTGLNPLKTIGKESSPREWSGQRKLDGEMKEDGVQRMKGPGTGSFFCTGKSET
jgi:hypothetical protein